MKKKVYQSSFFRSFFLDWLINRASLRCFVWAFSRCAGFSLQWLLLLLLTGSGRAGSVAVAHGPCGVRAQSLWLMGPGARRLSRCGWQALWSVGSVATARGPGGVQAQWLWLAGPGECRLSSSSVVAVHGLSRSSAHGVFPAQWSNPCPLHCQVDS